MQSALVENEQAERLAKHPFTKGMARHHIETLSKSAMPIEFNAGEIIFRAGEHADGFYLVESGVVAIETSKHQDAPMEIDRVRAGEPLGWSWMFEPYEWEFDARALESTKTIFFSREDLWKHHEEDLTLGHELFKRSSAVMVRRLQNARRKRIEQGRTQA